MINVPFVDLKAQYEEIKVEIDAAIRRVVESAAFILGPEVDAFEREFADYVGAKFCVGVNSGTAAIQLAVTACGAGPGDEVIVPAHTFFATAEGVSTAGATPVFVDVDPASYNIDAARVEAAITARTRAVMPVHLYGQAADLDALSEVAARHDLILIEDAAQAHGARYKGRRVGAFGRAACFSFYPGKNLGAYGEGGAITTDDPEVARRARMLRDHGAERKYSHEMIGYNFRLEGIQGAVLRAKLPHLDRWNQLRRAHAASYRDLLANLDLELPQESAHAEHVYHLYVVQTENRDALQKALGAEGVQTGIHYPVPLHRQPAYAAHPQARAGLFPVAERAGARVLSLPMYAEVSEAQLRHVAEACARALSATAALPPAAAVV